MVNKDHKVDVFKRGEQTKLKTLDIEYMRHSLVVDDVIFIGTEEKILYMVDVLEFNILDKIQTQNFIFAIQALSNDTVICG